MTNTATAAGVSIEGITEERLPNGLRVLYFPDPGRPTVTVNITYRVGSRHERHGEYGLAHLLEHMQFKGTANYPDIPKLFRERGATFNGTTSLDRTNYYETLPATSENLQLALELEADRLRGSSLSEQDLVTEKQVVLNELAQGENQPFRLLLQRTLSTAYQWHNYGRPTIGHPGDIAATDIRVLRAFYDRYYQPDNALLVVAGAFDQAEARRMVQESFGLIPGRSVPDVGAVTGERPQDGPRHVTIQRVGQVPLLAWVYHIPSGSDEAFPAIQVLSSMLSARGYGLSYRRFVETGRAASVMASAVGLHDPGHLLLAASLESGTDVEELQQELTRCIHDEIASSLDKELLERAKQERLHAWEEDFLDSENAALDLSEWEARGDWRLMFLHRDRLEQLTLDEVRQVAQTYLVDNNRTVGTFLPVSHRDDLPQIAVPNIQEILNGYVGRPSAITAEPLEPSLGQLAKRVEWWPARSHLQAATISRRTRGGTSILGWRLRFGSLATMMGRQAASELLGRMLTRGTAQATDDQLRARLTKLRASLQCESGPGGLDLVVYARRPGLHETIELVRECLREPRFLAAELDIVRQQMTVSLQSRMADPQALAHREFQRRLANYPPTDPRYMPTHAEEIEQLSQVSLADLEQYYAEHVNGDAALFAAVGDFETRELEQYVPPVTDQWNALSPYERIVRDPQAGSHGTFEIQVDDKPNATVMAGRLLDVQRGDAASLPLLVAAEVLGGGGLSSRLGTRIRQQAGLSYSVWAAVQLANYARTSPLTVQAIVAPSERGRLGQLIREEFSRWLDTGISPQELEKAKHSILEAEQRRRTDDGRVLRLLLESLDAGRDFSFYQNEEQCITNLSKEDVDEVSRQYLDPNDWMWIEAGDFR